MASAMTFAPAGPSITSFPTSYDPDMDSFFDFDGTAFYSPPPAKLSPSIDTIDPASIIAPSEHADELQILPPPSHEYGLHRQQTTMAYNLNGFNNTFAAQPQPRNNGKQRASQAQPVAFAAPLAYDSTFDTNMDFDPSAQAFPYSNNSMSMLDTYVDPLAEFDDDFTKVNRIYPGMHSARSQVVARHQQQPLPMQTVQQAQLPVPAQQPAQNPVVEDKISRLLNHMRQSSMASSIEDDAASPSNEHSSHLTRMRKDDEDMDEDERLLASEEGKKLSSKERRQLRNKVSARAFRSRRKGESCNCHVYPPHSILINLQGTSLSSRAR